MRLFPVESVNSNAPRSTGSESSAAAGPVPRSTVVVASNYHGKQQGQATGFLASAIPLAQVVSLLIAGALAYLVHCGVPPRAVADLNLAQLSALAASGNDVAGRVVAVCGAALKPASARGLRRRLDARVAKHAGIT